MVEKVKRVLQWFGSLLNTLGAIMGCIAVPLTLFAVIWVIVGSAWTFGIDRSDHTCPSAMYDFTFGYLICAWIFLVLGIPGICHTARANGENREEMVALIARLRPTANPTPTAVPLPSPARK